VLWVSAVFCLVVVVWGFLALLLLEGFVGCYWFLWCCAGGL
jgi:hypothetical protein